MPAEHPPPEHDPEGTAQNSIVSLQQTMERLSAHLVTYTESSDCYARKLIILTWALIGLTLLLIVIAVVTIEDARQSASLQNNIALNGQFYIKPNPDIMYAKACARASGDAICGGGRCGGMVEQRTNMSR